MSSEHWRYAAVRLDGSSHYPAWYYEHEQAERVMHNAIPGGPAVYKIVKQLVTLGDIEDDT